MFERQMLTHNIDLSLQHNTMFIDEVLPVDFQKHPALDKKLRVRSTKRGGVVQRTVIGEVTEFDKFRKNKEIERFRKVKEQLMKQAAEGNISGD